MAAPQLRLVPPKKKDLPDRQWPESAGPLLDGQHGSYLITAEESGAGVTSLIRDAARARLLAGTDPDRLLIVTHSKRSALAFEEALWDDLVASRSDEENAAPYVAESKLAQSVHSLAFSIVHYAAIANNVSAPRLMTGAEQDAVIRELLKGNQEAGGEYWPAERVEALDYVGFARGLRDFLLRAGERGKSAADVKKLGEQENKPLWVAAGAFLEEYTAVMNLQQMHHLNASELLITAVRALEDNPALLEKMRNRYDFLAVDNAQHLDPLSQKLVEMIGEHTPIFVVGGNTNGLVYSFRGANTDLVEDKSGKTVITLEQSFRRPSDKRIIYTHTAGDNFSVIARELREVHLIRDIPWEDMVVITRSLSQIPALQRALATADVPVHIDSTDVVLVEQSIVQAMLQAVDIVMGNGTEEDIIELATGPIGGADPITLRRIQREIGELGPVVRGAAGVAEDARLGEQAESVLTHLSAVIQTGREAVERGDSLELILWSIWEATGLSTSKMYTALRGGPAAAQANRDLNAMMELFDVAGDYVERVKQPSLEGFIEHLTSQDLPTGVRERQVVAPKAVALLTAHGAIDDEWNTVILAGADDDSWPSLGLTGTIFDQEELVDLIDENVDPDAYIDRLRERLHEEQRLFSLVTSRATDTLVITAINPAEEDSPLPQPSRFVRKLEEDETFSVSTVVETDELAVKSSRPFIAELRRALTSADSSDEEKEEAADLLAMLADAGFSEADPTNWWGLAGPTDAQPLREPGQPATLSPSQVESGLQCPLKMVLNSVTPTESSSALREGNLLHALAEASVTLQQDEETWKEAEQLVLDAYLSSRTVPPWKEKADEEEFVEVMNATVSKMTNLAGDLVGVEIPMDVTVGQLDDGSPIRIKGRLDRVHRDSEGRMKVYDLKTGRSAPTYQEAESHPQMAVYQLGINHSRIQENPLEFVTDDGSGGALQSGGAELVYPRSTKKPSQKPLTEDNARILMDNLRQLVHHTSGSTVPALPNKHCGSCAYRIICPITEEGRSINEVHS